MPGFGSASGITVPMTTFHFDGDGERLLSLLCSKGVLEEHFERSVAEGGQPIPNIRPGPQSNAFLALSPDPLPAAACATYPPDGLRCVLSFRADKRAMQLKLQKEEKEKIKAEKAAERQKLKEARASKKTAAAAAAAAATEQQQQQQQHAGGASATPGLSKSAPAAAASSSSSSSKYGRRVMLVDEDGDVADDDLHIDLYTGEAEGSGDTAGDDSDTNESLPLSTWKKKKSSSSSSSSTSSASGNVWLSSVQPDPSSTSSAVGSTSSRKLGSKSATSTTLSASSSSSSAQRNLPYLSSDDDILTSTPVTDSTFTPSAVSVTPADMAVAAGLPQTGKSPYWKPALGKAKGLVAAPAPAPAPAAAAAAAPTAQSTSTLYGVAKHAATPASSSSSSSSWVDLGPLTSTSSSKTGGLAGLPSGTVGAGSSTRANLLKPPSFLAASKSSTSSTTSASSTSSSSSSLLRRHDTQQHHVVDLLDDDIVSTQTPFVPSSSSSSSSSSSLSSSTSFKQQTLGSIAKLAAAKKAASSSTSTTSALPTGMAGTPATAATTPSKTRISGAGAGAGAGAVTGAAAGVDASDTDDSSGGDLDSLIRHWPQYEVLDELTEQQEEALYDELHTLRDTIKTEVYSHEYVVIEWVADLLTIEECWRAPFAHHSLFTK